MRRAEWVDLTGSDYMIIKGKQLHNMFARVTSITITEAVAWPRLSIHITLADGAEVDYAYSGTYTVRWEEE